jgi:hypothetical protein
MPGTFGTHKKFVAKKEKNKAAAAAKLKQKVV